MLGHEWTMHCGVVLVPLKYEANGTFHSDTLPIPINLRRLTRWRDHRAEKIRMDRPYREKRISQRFLHFNPNLKTRAIFDDYEPLESKESEVYSTRRLLRDKLYYADMKKGRPEVPESAHCSIYHGKGDPHLSVNRPPAKDGKKSDEGDNIPKSFNCVFVDDSQEDNLLWGQEYYTVVKDGKKRTMTNEQMETFLNRESDLAIGLRQMGYAVIARGSTNHYNRAYTSRSSGAMAGAEPNRKAFNYLEEYPVECYETTLIRNSTECTSILKQHNISYIDDAMVLASQFNIVRRFLNVKSYEEDAPKIVSAKDLLLKKLDRIEDSKGKRDFTPLNITQVYARSYKTGKQHYEYPGLKWDPFHYACRRSKMSTEQEASCAQYRSKIILRGGKFYKRKLVPCPRIHIWLLEAGLGEPFLNLKLLKHYSDSIHEPFHIMIPSYRDTRLADKNHLQMFDASDIDGLLYNTCLFRVSDNGKSVNTVLNKIVVLSRG